MRGRQRIFGALRLLGLSLVIAVAAAAFTVKKSVATVKHELFEFGDGLSTLVGSFRSSGVQRLLINEQPIQLEVVTTSMSVPAVLDRVEEWCGRHAGRFPEQIDEIHGYAGRFVDSSAYSGIMREVRGDRGFVACLDTGGSKLTAGELAARISRYGRSKDVHDIGDFHYVRVEAAGKATRIIRVWVDERFTLERMFPRNGDAPGSDAPGVPRPRSGRRLLSSEIAGNGYRWTVYSDVIGTFDAVVSEYKTSLARAGWSLVPMTNDQTIVARRGEQAVVVAVVPAQGGMTVSIASVAGKETP